MGQAGGAGARGYTITRWSAKHPDPPTLQGLIPIVGAAREAGTSMLIEDVACPVDKLADMMIDLIDMFQRYGYHDASCFGHALEGNLHLVFSQVCGEVWEMCGGLGQGRANFSST